MKINLSQGGKRFNREWIFRHASFEFDSSKSYAITGPNGSGKSTLLQAIAGMLQLSEGSIDYKKNDTLISSDQTYQLLSFCAPYLDIIEEMTLMEFIQFHFGFKERLNGIDDRQIAEAIGLQNAAHKQIRYYSSGMKQRVKLAQAFFSNTSLLLLDEPCSNLDATGIALYHSLIEKYGGNRLIIVSSNDEVEYNFTSERISIMDYKS